MKSDEREQLKRRHFTIPELWEKYQREDRPLDAEMILATLEPLSGTSFFQRATQALKDILPVRPPHALDVYGAFHGLLMEWEEPLA